jgi:ACS family tartrate transporter-like MFS transporter
MEVRRRVGGDVGSSTPIGVVSQEGVETSAMRKVSLRIIPFAVVGMFISYIDRVNVGFAALEMNRDLGFDATVFGWGVSAFFVTLCLSEVPSNMMMRRLGARLWLARIMITWGLVSGAMAFITGIKSFVFVRLLLGAAEAGFFPGIVLFLTLWFPKEYRAKAMALFVMALPLSNFIGSPISGALLGVDGWLGLRGWQWLFLVEAAPAVILGALTLIWLPNSSAEAGWLTDGERRWLSDRLRSEREQPVPVSVAGTWRIMFAPRVLALALIYSGSVGCSYAMSYWQPQMIKALGLTNLQTGFVNAIPFGFAAVTMVIWARHSDQRRERLWHTALPFLACAGGLAACVVLTTLVPTVCALTVAVVGSYAVKAPLFALTAESLSEQASAVGIAQVCAVGNIAGLVCPLLIGWAKDASGSFSIGLLPMVALALIAAVTTLVIGRATARPNSSNRFA